MPGMRNLFPLMGAQFPGCQLIIGGFVCNGASAPTDIGPANCPKFTVSAPATGLYTITLQDGAVAGEVLGVVPFMMDPAANSTKRVLVANFTNLTVDGTMTLQTQSATGTDANLSAPVVAGFMIVVASSVVVRG